MLPIGLKIPLFVVIFAVIAYYTDLFKDFTIPQEESVKRNSEKAQQQAERKRQEIEKAILKNKEITYDEECSPLSGTCYIISDEVQKIQGQLIARRSMKIKGSRIVFTVMNLEIPEKLSWDNMKPIDWPVAKLIVPVQYCQLQIAIGFITGALRFDSMTKQQILMIGLGGGSISTFLSQLQYMDIHLETTVVELDPFMVKLAGKYFDHTTEAGVTNLFVRDGVEFLEEAVNAERRYRSILLDACYGDDELKTGLVCPIKEFLSEKVIQNLFDSLEEGGVLSINTLSLKDSGHHEKEALKEYTKVFPSCDLVPYLRARNMIVCSKRNNWTWQEERSRFQKNLQNVIERFDFQHLKILYDF